MTRESLCLRPVADWAHYNHGYTARILNGAPANDTAAYKALGRDNFAKMNA
jgi:hypothetical protein